jgi:hypothetical protein
MITHIALVYKPQAHICGEEKVVKYGVMKMKNAPFPL